MNTFCRFFAVLLIVMMAVTVYLPSSKAMGQNDGFAKLNEEQGQGRPNFDLNGLVECDKVHLTSGKSKAIMFDRHRGATFGAATIVIENTGSAPLYYKLSNWDHYSCCCQWDTLIDGTINPGGMKVLRNVTLEYGYQFELVSKAGWFSGKVAEGSAKIYKKGNVL